MGSCIHRAGEGIIVSAALFVVATALLAPAPAHAQRTQYKWADPAGRIHYSDLPPPVDRRVTTSAIAPPASQPAGPGDPTLPWALRSAAFRYPVVLYTSLDCEPCEVARTHLSGRGVPYTEKRVEDAGDLQAFEALGFGTSLFPSASIGREKFTGFEAGAWTRALDASGYPKASMLPPTRAARSLEPMRVESAPAIAAAATPEGAAQPADAAASSSAQATVAQENKGSFKPSSFRTGPNPIRF